MKKHSVVKKVRNQSGNLSGLRRKIGWWSTLGLLDFIPVTLYQLGMIRHLPDLPGKIFASDKVNASRRAQVAGLPDAPVSLLLYAGNLLLIAGAQRRKKKGFADLLISGNALAQAGGGAYYLFQMISKEKKICPYCVAGALINFATLLPAFRLWTRKS